MAFLSVGAHDDLVVGEIDVKGEHVLSRLQKDMTGFIVARVNQTSLNGNGVRRSRLCENLSCLLLESENQNVQCGGEHQQRADAEYPRSPSHRAVFAGKHVVQDVSLLGQAGARKVVSLGRNSRQSAKQ